MSKLNIENQLLFTQALEASSAKYVEAGQATIIELMLQVKQVLLGVYA